MNETCFENVPVSARVEVVRNRIRPSDIVLEDEDVDNPEEIYWDFINWAMKRHDQALLSVPVQENIDFIPVQLNENGNDVSAFNTMDFKRLHPDNFDRKKYAISKVWERLYDLAETASCISHQEGRRNIKRKFAEVVNCDLKRDSQKLRAWQLWKDVAYSD